MEHLFLTRRNLLSLLSKLDRKKAGEDTACTLIKCDTVNSNYPQSCDCIIVTAVEDADYYIDRVPGIVHEKDIPTSETPHT
jgi:hypothetical protein